MHALFYVKLKYVIPTTYQLRVDELLYNTKTPGKLHNFQKVLWYQSRWFSNVLEIHGEFEYVVIKLEPQKQVDKLCFDEKHLKYSIAWFLFLNRNQVHLLLWSIYRMYICPRYNVSILYKVTAFTEQA